MFVLQCNNQVPGLSATTRRVIDCPEGISNTSLRIGFTCPSTIGGLSAGSLKFNDRPTIIDLCPCKWLYKKKTLTLRGGKGKKENDLQRMFACIRVSDHNIENLKMVKDDTQGSISFLNSRIRSKTEFRKDSRN